MDEKIKKEPAIRFKGFTEPWEQCKLGQVLKERNEQISENEEYPLMSFVQGVGVTPKGNRYDRSFLVKDEDKKYKKTEKGDFIYSSNNLETGSIGFNKTGKAVISPVYSIFSSKNELESLFIGILSTRKDFIARMLKYRQGVVYGQWRIHESEFLRIAISVPCFKEQKKIIDVFNQLDKLITLQQRELDLMKKEKKTLLSKMFPKTGEQFPEIRFKGFTEPWELRKFENIAERLSTKALSSDRLPYVEYEDITSEEGVLNRDVFCKESRKSGILFSEHNVLYGKLRPYLHNWLNPDFKGIAVGDWWVLNPINTDKNFVYRLIQSKSFDTIANRSTGTKMPRADWKLVSQTEFAIPISLTEQAQIGACFTNLDHLITLQQRQLDQMKIMKKSLLKAMFV